MDLTKAIEIFEKSSHVGIILPSGPSYDILASAEVLVRVLKEKGKQVGLLNSLGLDSSTRGAFGHLSSSSALPREFVVSLNTSQSPVSQMRYEKEEGRIDVIFSPREKNVQKEQVSFREGNVLCDCAISVGLPDIEAVEELKINPEVLQNIPLVNIDYSAHNKSYGEVNLVNTDKSSLVEIIYEVVVAYRTDPLSKDAATILLSALVSATGNFSSPAVSADTMLCASELMRLGATLSEAKQSPYETKSPELLQLLGRAAVRTKMEKERGVLWSFLTTEDFEKTSRSSKDLLNVMNHLEKEFPPHKISALIWQNPEDGLVRAYLGGERDMISRLQTQDVGKFQSPYLLVNASFENFKQAEEILNSLFGSVL